MVDLSKLFPDYERATCEYVDDRAMATVKLHSGGSFATIRLSVEHIYQALGDLRTLMPRTKSEAPKPFPTEDIATG